MYNNDSISAFLYHQVTKIVLTYVMHKINDCMAKYLYHLIVNAIIIVFSGPVCLAIHYSIANVKSILIVVIKMGVMYT